MARGRWSVRSGSVRGPSSPSARVVWTLGRAALRRSSPGALPGTTQHDASAWECDIGKVKVRSHDGAGTRGWTCRPRRAVDSAIPSEPVGDDRPRDRRVPTATIGLGPLRPAPAGLPDPAITPPTIAEAGDPFTAVRVIDLLARLERGTPDPPGRHRRPAQRDLSRLAVQRPGRRRRRAPAPGQLDGRLPEQLRDRRRGRPARADDRRSRTRAGSTRGSSARRSARRPSCTERLAEFSRRDRPTSGG